MTMQSAPAAHVPPAPEIPIDQLVVDVYSNAAPAVRSSMLAKLVGKVYQSAAPDDRGFLIRLLIQPLGLLSLLAVSAQAMHSLAQWLSSSPALVSSAAAAILVKILLDCSAQRCEA